MKNKYILLICILLFSQKIFADELVEHTKFWTAVQLSGAMTDNKKWNYYIEPQLRLMDDKYKFNQALLRLGVYYQTRPDLSFWIGIHRGYDIKLNGRSAQEYRLWERVSWDIVNNDKIKLNSRSIPEAFHF